MAAESDLLVVGAGAKAAGLAAKVHAFNTLGLGPVSLKTVEATEVAASWKGRNGMTSGEEPLAVTPIKDIGFPYQSWREFGEAGEAIDDATMQFTWQRFMVARRRYARWIDAGSPSVRHRDYGEYLTWVLERARAGVEHVDGRVARGGNRVTPFGAFYDSTLDRMGDAALFGGIALYFVRGGVPANLQFVAVAAALVTLAAVLIVSYARARAEGLSLDCKVGIAQRAERILGLGIPSLFIGAGPDGLVLFGIVAILGLMAVITVVQRILHVYHVTRSQASAPAESRQARHTQARQLTSDVANPLRERNPQ